MTKEQLLEKIGLLADAQGSQSSIALGELLKDVIEYVGEGGGGGGESGVPLLKDVTVSIQEMTPEQVEAVGAALAAASMTHNVAGSYFIPVDSVNGLPLTISHSGVLPGGGEGKALWALSYALTKEGVSSLVSYDHAGDLLNFISIEGGFGEYQQDEQ